MCFDRRDFQRYWDYLDNPVNHPDGNESGHTKQNMSEMAAALSSMDLSSWEPLVEAEASDKSCRVAHSAAISRICPIQEATDYWNPTGNAQESIGTDLGGPAPGQDSHNVDT
jgi:hypothetical protein